MRTTIWILSALLLVSVALGEELHREKKDISKLQALFGGWKQKSYPYPVVSFDEIKKPVYYVPPQPCNCNWRPTTRYAEGVVPAVVFPSRPALVGASFIAQPPVISAAPARVAPPPPPPPAFLPAAPALSDQPCLQPDGGYNYDRPLPPHNH